MTPDLSGFVLAGRMSVMPKPHPQEFRGDVVYPARAQEAFLEGHVDAFDNIAGLLARHIR